MAQGCLLGWEIQPTWCPVDRDEGGRWCPTLARGGMVNQKFERHIMCSSISCLCVGDPRGWDITVIPVDGTSHKIKDKWSLTRMVSVIESTGCDKMRLKIKYWRFYSTGGVNTAYKTLKKRYFRGCFGKMKYNIVLGDKFCAKIDHSARLET